MKRLSQGFTLIETAIATGILVTASVAIASLFVSSVRTNLNNLDRSAADLLLSDKIEQLSTTSLSDPQWTAGNYMEYVSIASDGAPTISATDATLKYQRAWQISAGKPRTLTVIVYTNHSAVTGRQTELIRASVVAAPRW